MENTIKDTTITFKLTEELKKEIQEQAKKEARTMSNLLIKIITEYLQKN